MKHCPSTFVLICAILTMSLPLIADNLWDVIEDAQRAINQKYTELAKDSATSELKEIINSDKTNDQKIELIRSTFLSTATTEEQKQLNNPSSSSVQLIYHQPIEWTIHSIEIAYDIDSETNILLSTETLYQEEERKNRDDSSGISQTHINNNTQKKQTGTNAGLGIISPSSFTLNPLKWLHAKADFQWINDDLASNEKSNSKSSQWNERAQRALTSIFEEKQQILKNTRIKKCHLTFSITLKNNTDLELFFVPRNISIPIWAGNEHLTDAIVSDKSLQTVRIYPNAYVDQMFRADLDDTKALRLINYMRSHAPDILIERGSFEIASKDGKFQDAIHETLQNKTIPFRYRDLELHILKVHNGKQTTVGDVMRAINEAFENPWFGFSDNCCTSLMGIQLDNEIKKVNLQQLPVITINGNPTSGPISEDELNQPLSNDAFIVDVADILNFRDESSWWINVTDRMRKHYASCLKTSAESDSIESQAALGICYLAGLGVSKDPNEGVKWERRAADQGNVIGQLLLGDCYFHGIGVPQSYTEAAKWYRKAADQGDALAQVCVGDCYVKGIGVPQNNTEAVKWYRKAADQGNALGQCALASCFIKGIGILQNNTEALRLYRLAAEQEFALAQGAIGDCYALGIGVPQNDTEAVRWYRKAAEKGVAVAQGALGECYAEGIGVNQDYAEAAKWYRKAAEQGDESSQASLGDCYYNGVGVIQNYTEAMKWYQKAAEQGNIGAQIMCGDCYLDGVGCNQDYAEAVKWYQKAADQGHAVAQGKLADCYKDGIGVPQNDAEAVKWYRKAADQGLDIAQFILGVCYHDGIGVAQSNTEAAKWFRKAADQGIAEAQYLLGVCYYNGTGVPKNNTEAAKWHRLAAEQEFAIAQAALGDCYALGAGVPQNYTEAAKWYRKAAEQGMPEAQFALGCFFAEGIGVRQDKREAEKWLRLAADNGVDDAREALQELRK